MNKVKVRESPIKGKGVFAASPMVKGNVILKIDDSVIVDPNDPRSKDVFGQEPDHCDYLPDGTIVLMQEPERYINHSCDPNSYTCTIGKQRFIVAMRDIAVGEEIVSDYSLNQVGGDLLDCRCGSPRCRGSHRSDFFALPKSRQLEYLPYLNCSFLRIHRDRILKLLDKEAEQPAGGDT